MCVGEAQSAGRSPPRLHERPDNPSSEPPSKVPKTSDPHALADALASQFCSEASFNADNALKVFAACPDDKSLRWQANSSFPRVVTLGAYNRGGVTGVRTVSRSMPSVCKFFCACVRQVAPSFQFTTVIVTQDMKSPVHQDCFNSSLPNLLIPLTFFAGGHVFVEHPEGRDKHLLDGQEFTGFRLDCDQAPWSFDAKHCRHFTLDWEGSRVMLVAFTVGYLTGLSPADRQELRDLGFNPSSEDVQHGPKFLPFRYSTNDIRRPFSGVATDTAPRIPVVPSAPYGDLPGEGPLLIEICAGSASLSHAAAQRGFSVMPIDHTHNRHRQKCKILDLDLSKKHAWDILEFVIKHRTVALAFAAPPCGTCSAARNIRPGPPILRTKQFPWGVPWASHSDWIKLKASNAIYKSLADFIQLCDQHNVAWCVENPTNSALWTIPCFAYALAHGIFAHCQACAFGSGRDKRTSFLCSHHAIDHMARMCPGCSMHEPWGVDPQGSFNTSKEAEYPPQMCQALCDVADAIAAERQLPLGAAQPILAKAHRQARGRLHPQLISEYACVLKRTLPKPPALSSKQCITHNVLDVPAGSKLVRSEKKGDGSWLCIFGVYRSFDQFVIEAQGLLHPFDTLAQLPDYLIKALFEQLTLSPMQLSKTRLERLQKWRDRAKQLAPQEEKLRAQMPENVRRILSCKRTLLLQEMAEEIDWPDREFFAELRDGFRLVGCLRPSGIFRPGVTPSALSEEELMAQSHSLKAMILDSISRASAGEHDAELYDLTLKEASSKGWLRGPYSPSQMDSMMKVWLPVRRFCVIQKGKLRAIDDFKENLLNNACCVAEKIVLQAIDHVIWSLNVLCHFYRLRGACDFTLSTGQRLVGTVHPDWERVGPDLKVSTIDLKSAYKQLPLSPCEYNKTVVCLKNPGSRETACFIMHTLPFGALASVYHFLRASFLLHALGCHLGIAWGAFFDDFPMASHSAVASSTQATVRALLSLTGFEFADDKCPPFHSEVEALGVVLDVSKSCQGIIQVKNKQSRIDELKPILDNVLAMRRVTPCELPSFLGKLQYADAQVWGRAGRMALRELRSRGSFSRVPVSLDPSGVEAVRLLRDRLIGGKPRTIHAAWQEQPMIVFHGRRSRGEFKSWRPSHCGRCLVRSKEARTCLCVWFDGARRAPPALAVGWKDPCDRSSRAVRIRSGLKALEKAS